jgi:hypothetical protein
MCRILVFFFFLGWMDVELSAQGDDQLAHTRHFSPSVGLGWYTFRDFGTSPLFYDGPGLNLSLGSQWSSTRSESRFNASTHFALTSANVPQSNFLQAGGSAFFLDFRIDGAHLRRLRKPASERLEVLAGGRFVSDLLLRQNSGFGNAQVGTDVLVNFLASGKVSYDFSRQNADTLNLKLIRLRRKPKTQKLDFQLDVGVLNFNYRPGYAYVHDSELTGEPGLSWALADHRWRLNGWRLGTALGYQRQRSNGNATRIDYCWEAVHAPGRFNALQFASHQVRLVFMFNTKKPNE